MRIWLHHNGLDAARAGLSLARSVCYPVVYISACQSWLVLAVFRFLPEMKDDRLFKQDASGS